MNMDHGAHKVCAITDPFCAGAIGSKWPNLTGSKTLAFPARGRWNISTDANGNGSILIVPQYSAQVVGAASIGGDAAVFSALLTPVFPVITGVTQYRVVSWGFKLRNTAAPMLSSGIVRVRLFSDSGYASSATSLCSSYKCIDALDVSLQDTKEVCVMPPRTGTQSTFFVPIEPITVSSALPATGWSYAQVSIIGGPATSAPVDIELFYNYELSFNDDSTLSMIQTPSPPENTTLTQASSYVSHSIGSFVKNGAKAVEDLAIRYGKQYLMRALGGAMGGPVGGLAGSMMALTVD